MFGSQTGRGGNHRVAPTTTRPGLKPSRPLLSAGGFAIPRASHDDIPMSHWRAAVIDAIKNVDITNVAGSSSDVVREDLELLPWSVFLQHLRGARRLFGDSLDPTDQYRMDNMLLMTKRMKEVEEAECKVKEREAAVAKLQDEVVALKEQLVAAEETR